MPGYEKHQLEAAVGGFHIPDASHRDLLIPKQVDN
jgi:hypothetical protein